MGLERCSGDNKRQFLASRGLFETATGRGTRPDTSRKQLLATAFVDGELSEQARREFEQRLPLDPALAREVAELEALTLLFRRIVYSARSQRRLNGLLGE